jgi:Tol biopolymer transport system component
MEGSLTAAMSEAAGAHARATVMAGPRERYALILIAAVAIAGCEAATPGTQSPRIPLASETIAPASAPSVPPSASPAPTLDLAMLEGRMLFTRAGNDFGDETVFTVRADGTDELRITGFGATCCPRWSPDGDFVLSAAMAPDGRITTQLLMPDGEPVRVIPLPPGGLNLGCSQAWSTATGRLACEGWDDDDPSRQGIYTVNASDGEDLVRVTESTGGSQRPFDFSVDGSQIFYFEEGSLGLFAVNVDGTGLRRITPEDLTVEAIDVGSAGGRRSPDGRQIVFGDEAGVLWTVHPDGTAPTPLYEDPERRMAASPTWSPDGAHLLFALDPAGTDANIDEPPSNGLYVMNTDGTNATPLIVSRDWKRNPDWAE